MIIGPKVLCSVVYRRITISCFDCYHSLRGYASSGAIFRCVHCGVWLEDCRCQTQSLWLQKARKLERSGQKRVPRSRTSTDSGLAQKGSGSDVQAFGEKRPIELSGFDLDDQQSHRETYAKKTQHHFPCYSHTIEWEPRPERLFEWFARWHERPLRFWSAISLLSFLCRRISTPRLLRVFSSSLSKPENSTLFFLVLLVLISFPPLFLIKHVVFPPRVFGIVVYYCLFLFFTYCSKEKKLFLWHISRCFCFALLCFNIT